MRLSKFESAGQKPLGEGSEKRSFINPEDERKNISEKKGGEEKDTPRQLKGRYYLTKIAHLLLPQNIPDISQVRESAEGKQTIDTERISHTQGHALLQELRQLDKDEEPARKQIIEEMGKEMTDITLKIADIGLGFNIDENVGNYTKDEKGNVYYLETFKPWQVDTVNPKELETLFSEEELRKAIKGISNQEMQEKCTQYLDRLLVLLGEEQQELQKHPETNLMDSGPHIKELEAILAPFMMGDILATLRAVKTEKEALDNTERKSAKQALNLIFSRLKNLKEETNITDKEYDKLYEKYKTLSRAVGMINGGAIDHNR